MGCFEAVRHISGGEVYDNCHGRVVEQKASFSAAEHEAARLNRATGKSDDVGIARALGRSVEGFGLRTVGV